MAARRNVSSPAAAVAQDFLTFRAGFQMALFPARKMQCRRRKPKQPLSGNVLGVTYFFQSHAKFQHRLECVNRRFMPFICTLERQQFF